MKVKTLNGNKNIIGQNIKKFRREKKMSQPEVKNPIGWGDTIKQEDKHVRSYR